MKLFSQLTAVLLMPVLAACNSNLPGREGDITPYLNNTVNYALGDGTMLKRQFSYDGSICGRRLAFFNHLNRGEDSANEYDYTLDNDTNEAPQLDKILGGVYATCEIPWHVALLYDKQYVCSGAIISEFWVLTAGHCLFKRPQLSSFLVTAGDHRLNYLNALERDYEVEKVFIHLLYTDIPLDYDIGLMKIKAGRYGEGFRFNSHVQPVCLANSEETPPIGTKLTVSGWGYTHKESGASDVLKKTILPVLDVEACKKLFHGWTSKGTICVGYYTGDTELCEGDSGGPATALVGLSTVLYGFLSYGHGCDPPNVPSLLTSVPYYRVWIGMTILRFGIGKERNMPQRIPGLILPHLPDY